MRKPTGKKLPKISLIIGKKQILVAGMVVVLGAAIYGNYVAAQGGKSLAQDGGANVSANAAADTRTAGDKSELPNYGDAEFVSAPASAVKDSDAYFTQARLAKQESRDEAEQFLKSMINGGDVTGSEVAAISHDAAYLSKYIESESKIENILKAQGFTDVLVYLSDKGANVIVKTDGLSPADAAKIKEAILSEVDVAVDGITIVEIK